jgi:hypothetical protein
MNATELEVNHERIEAMVEPYKGVRHIKATHALTALQLSTYEKSLKDGHSRKDDGCTQSAATA